VNISAHEIEELTATIYPATAGLKLSLRVKDSRWAGSSLKDFGDIEITLYGSDRAAEAKLARIADAINAIFAEAPAEVEVAR
jgi:hypothetical protein